MQFHVLREDLHGVFLRDAQPSGNGKGWDRTDKAWAFANRLGIADVVLGADQTNVAAAIRSRRGTHISVVDAHVGSVLQSSTTDRVSVITSDPSDMKAVAEAKPVVVVTI